MFNKLYWIWASKPWWLRLIGFTFFIYILKDELLWIFESLQDKANWLPFAFTLALIGSSIFIKNKFGLYVQEKTGSNEVKLPESFTGKVRIGIIIILGVIAIVTIVYFLEAWLDSLFI